MNAHNSPFGARVPCDLLIGDERRFAGGAEHVSCTVEMTPIDTPVDVAVIDEVQMIADPERGWAWTRALLGLPGARCTSAARPAHSRWCGSSSSTHGSCTGCGWCRTSAWCRCRSAKAYAVTTTARRTATALSASRTRASCG
ncbi:hypothetical protein STCU_11692 [Strigomonas culicis]|uniref:ATP-dependent RNA helicase SUV3 DEXQ-box helicase domain-containing protein n=1 Tax=Strigomonas culicis TaxID=28005 RepID=S9TCY8_9TRYP|nr:hypothetical protein STCU_11692 [Strigomonas culicis]|eukprot:EPY15892.1 hypothetical protein STCU_11692 [Strigomonas culicis]